MEIILRATAIYFFLWLLLRSLGKRELAEMTSFELVLVVTMGDLVQQGVTQEDFSVTGAILAVGTIAFWILISSYVTFRWKSTAGLIEGLPAVVVRDGKLLDEPMKIERLTDEEVLSAARQQGIASLGDIRFGIVESDGKFTFIRTDAAPPPPDQEHQA